MVAAVESKTTGKALDAMARVDSSCLSRSEAEACEDMNLAMFQYLLAEYNMAEIIPRKANGKSILATGAGARSPVVVGGITMFFGILEAQGGLLDDSHRSFRQLVEHMDDARRAHPEPSTRYRSAMMLFASQVFAANFPLLDDFSWDSLYGRDGSDMMEVAVSYNYDTAHSFLHSVINGDMTQMPGLASIILSRYGNMPGYVQLVDQAVESYRRMLDEPNQVPEVSTLSMGMASYANILYRYDTPQSTTDAIVSMMHDYGMSWSEWHNTVEFKLRASVAFIREYGSTTRGAHFCSAEYLDWLGPIQPRREPYNWGIHLFLLNFEYIYM